MTSPVDTSVKFFHSEMPGAPTLSGLAGSLIGVLDACLINGFALKSVDSLTITSNVATMNISTGHSFEVGTVALVSGATPAALNGEQKITAITTSSVSFATSGISNQSATGVITVKLAPAGWAKPLSGTNIAAYQTANPTVQNPQFLRVNDTTTRYCTVVGYEAMSDINTGTGRFPTTVQQSTELFWSKSSAADSSPRRWIIIADSRAFYFSKEHNPSFAGNFEHCFYGDVVSNKAGDTFTASISGGTADYASSSNYNATWEITNSNNGWSGFMPRSYTGVGASCLISRISSGAMGSYYTSGDPNNNALSAFPNQSDGSIYLSPVFVREYNSRCIRGNVPGAYHVPQNVPAGVFLTKDVLTGQFAYPGKTFKALANAGAYAAVMFVDISGPWR